MAYTYYIRHANGQMHVCLISSSVEVIIKGNVLLCRPLVKRGIMEFWRGILNVLFNYKKNFTAVIIGYISIKCYDVC